MNDQHSYETGSTRPPKSHNGLIAVLLVAVILLCGITTVLGLMNIRLTLELKNSENSDYQVQFFSNTEAATESLSVGDQTAQPALGIRGQGLTELAQRFYRLPSGFWVQEVLSGGPAHNAGLQPGDILLSINGQATPDAASIQTALTNFAPGDTVQLLLCRNGSQYTTQLTLAENP